MENRHVVRKTKAAFTRNATFKLPDSWRAFPACGYSSWMKPKETSCWDPTDAESAGRQLLKWIHQGDANMLTVKYSDSWNKLTRFLNSAGSSTSSLHRPGLSGLYKYEADLIKAVCFELLRQVNAVTAESRPTTGRQTFCASWSEWTRWIQLQRGQPEDQFKVQGSRLSAVKSSLV